MLSSKNTLVRLLQSENGFMLQLAVYSWGVPSLESSSQAGLLYHGWFQPHICSASLMRDSSDGL